jgi:hypothetical protein
MQLSFARTASDNLSASWRFCEHHFRCSALVLSHMPCPFDPNGRGHVRCALSSTLSIKRPVRACDVTRAGYLRQPGDVSILACCSGGHMCPWSCSTLKFASRRALGCYQCVRRVRVTEHVSSTMSTAPAHDNVIRISCTVILPVRCRVLMSCMQMYPAWHVRSHHKMCLALALIRPRWTDRWRQLCRPVLVASAHPKSSPKQLDRDLAAIALPVRTTQPGHSQYMEF